MKYSEARKVLGLESAACTLTEEIVVTAWRGRCKTHHPDTAAVHKALGQEPRYTIDQLTLAKKTLLDDLEGADLACKLCNGSGKVRAKFGVATCNQCRGTGDKI